MKRIYVYLAALIFTGVVLTGCKESSVNPVAESGDSAIIKAVIASDSSTMSFDSNYDEEGILQDILGKSSATIRPIRVARKVTGITRNVSTQVINDTAYATMTANVTARLIIAASTDADSTIDTVITKNFTTELKRNYILVKRNNQNDTTRWKMIAYSLPSGKTTGSTLTIRKLTATFGNNQTFTLEDPLAYYLTRGWGRWRDIPQINKNEPVTLQVEVVAPTDDANFVTMTFGADFRGQNRLRKKLDLVSVSSISPNQYLMVYETQITSHRIAGFFHAVLDVMTEDSVTDDSQPVVSTYWGFPYIIKL